MRRQFRKAVAGVLAGVLLFQAPYTALADSEKVVTLGADLTQEQRSAMLDYFGVTEDEVTIIEVNNQEERSYLEGIARESEIGTHTYSCAYIMPTSTKKINVKTAHLTWVSTSMIANTLVTAGIDSCDVIAAAPRDVSGTGALTGIIKAYEKVTDEELDAEKTDLAMKELYETAELGSDIGQDEASALMNEVKTQVLKDGLQEQDEVKEVVQDVADYYNVELSDQQTDQVAQLMTDIGQQDYDYNDIKNTMGDLQDKLINNIDNVKESFDESVAAHPGFWAAIGNFFKNIFIAIGNFFADLFGGKDHKKAEEDEGLTIEEIEKDSILNDVDDSALGIEPTEEATQSESNNDSQMEQETVTQAPTEAAAQEEQTQTDSFTVDENSNVIEDTGANTDSNTSETSQDAGTESLVQ